MYEQIREDIFFILFYGIVTAMAMMARCYQGVRHVLQEKESQRKIVDWDRTYFLSNYYAF